MGVREARVAAQVIADERQDSRELANLAYYTALCPQRQWLQIALRIAGSWTAAVSLLVLAFALKGMPLG